MTVTVDTARCTGCGLCVGVCPVDALELVAGVVVVDAAACVDCGICADECPDKVISLPPVDGSR